MSANFAILGTIEAAAKLVFANRNDMLRVGFIFILGFFATGVIIYDFLLPMMTESQVDSTGQLVVDSRLPAAMLLTLVIEFLLFAVFGVGWHRVILLGAGRAGRGLGVQLGRRELRYFGRLWLCFLASFIIAVVFTLAEQLIGGRIASNPGGYIFVAEVGYLLVAGYALGRLGPAFAALSVDQKLSFVQSWRATQGISLHLFGIYILVVGAWLAINALFGTLAGALGLGQAAPYTLLLVGVIAFCAMFALLVTINALVFTRVAGGKAVV